MMIPNKLMALTLSSIVLSACGGGGGGDAASGSSETDGAATEPVELIEFQSRLFSEASSQKTLANYDAVEAAQLSGAGVTVAVFDSGMLETHDEFENIRLAAPSDQYGTQWLVALNDPALEEADGFEQFESIYVDSISDETGHGTHVSSIIAGKNIGYAPGVELIHIDNSKENGFIYSQVAVDMIFDVIEAGASIINVSQTGCIHYDTLSLVDDPSIPPYYFDAFTKLDESNSVLVCAAGNDNASLTEELVTKTSDAYGYVAADASLAKTADFADNFLYAVAINSDFELSTSANTNYPGTDVDMQNRTLSALGENVPGAMTNGDDDSYYIYMSGTSQAAPIVSASIAIVLEAFPALNAVQAAQVLLDTANDDFDGFNAEFHGRGVVDLEAALAVDPNEYL